MTTYHIKPYLLDWDEARKLKAGEDPRFAKTSAVFENLWEREADGYRLLMTGKPDEPMPRSQNLWHRGAGEFDVEAYDPTLACETAYAILNSYPEEMHCDAKYLPVVESYRAQQNRSLSMGDILLVTAPGSPRAARFGCATGWTLF